jgi:hypothetical protein
LAGSTRVLGAAVLIGLACASAAFGSRSIPGAGTIHVTDKLVKYMRVDVSRTKSQAGDFDFYRQLLYNEAITPKPIGHSDISCLHTGTGSMNCTGTYFLPRGKLMVGGVIESRLFYQLAVIGGTALYANARGTLTATFLGGDPARELLIFRLTV